MIEHEGDLESVQDMRRWSKIRLLEKKCWGARETEAIVRGLIDSVLESEWGYLGTDGERLLSITSELYLAESKEFLVQLRKGEMSSVSREHMVAFIQDAVRRHLVDVQKLGTTLAEIESYRSTNQVMGWTGPRKLNGKH